LGVRILKNFQIANNIRLLTGPKKMKKTRVTLNKIQALKFSSGWNTKEMSEYLGVTERAVQMWLKGDREMPRSCYELALIRTRIAGDTPADRVAAWNKLIADAERDILVQSLKALA